MEPFQGYLSLSPLWQHPNFAMLQSGEIYIHNWVLWFCQSMHRNEIIESFICIVNQIITSCISSLEIWLIIYKVPLCFFFLIGYRFFSSPFLHPWLPHWSENIFWYCNKNASNHNFSNFALWNFLNIAWVMSQDYCCSKLNKHCSYS